MFDLFSVIDDEKALVVAVRVAVLDHISMPMDEAVFDFQLLGVVQGPVGGLRSRVVVVVVRKEMVERVVVVVQGAGLEIEGIDLSAFGMVCALVFEYEGAMFYVNVAGLINVAVVNVEGCLFICVAVGGTEAIAAKLAEKRGLMFEYARQWMIHVGLVVGVEGIEGDLDLVSAICTALEDGVIDLADSICMSLNFYCIQESSEFVELGVVIGFVVTIFGFVEKLAEHLRFLLEACIVVVGEEVDVGWLTVVAGLAVVACPQWCAASVVRVCYTDRPMSVGVVAAVAAIFGVIVGSFFNVVVYWLLRKESLFYPGSWCSECGMLIKFYDNVPILGWLWLRGCCWACGAKISWCYLVVEVIVALLCVLCVLKFGADSDVWLLLVFVLLLILITLIDLEFMIILNLLTLIGVVVAIVFTVAFDSDYLVGHLIAGAAVGVFFLIVAIVYFVGMGMGDVKFVGMMGFVLGCAVVFVIFVALLFGTIVGVGVMVRYGVREGCKKGILFGFWLAAGSFVGLFFGDAIVDWYFDIFIS